MRRTSAEDDETAREELRGLMFAESSKRPRESRRRTVCLVMGSDFEKEGLSQLALETAAARFYSAGYRSGFHYLLEAKRMHVEHGHAWTEQLEQSLRLPPSLGEGNRPSKRAGELRVLQIRTTLMRNMRKALDGPSVLGSLPPFGCCGKSSWPTCASET